MPQFIIIKSAQGLRLNADEILSYRPTVDNKTIIKLKNGETVIYDQCPEDFDALVDREKTVREITQSLHGFTEDLSKTLQRFIRDFSATVGRIPTTIRMHY